MSVMRTNLFASLGVVLLQATVSLSSCPSASRHFQTVYNVWPPDYSTRPIYPPLMLSMPVCQCLNLSLSLSARPSVHVLSPPSAYLFAWLLAYLAVSLSGCVPTSLPVCLSVTLFLLSLPVPVSSVVCLFICLHVFLPVCPIYLTVCLLHYLSASLYICLLARQSVCLSVRLPIFQNLSKCLLNCANLS